MLTDLQLRRVKGVLIACIDYLKGFAETVASVLPQQEVQSCLVSNPRQPQT
ncbi:transposase [Pontibacter sp. 13R65]|uniref:transposase n=1 Tax=Pontibacter sp. 13R65 TaxID=3127458 RepID=UPI003FA76B90